MVRCPQCGKKVVLPTDIPETLKEAYKDKIYRPGEDDTDVELTSEEKTQRDDLQQFLHDYHNRKT